METESATRLESKMEMEIMTRNAGRFVLACTVLFGGIVWIAPVHAQGSPAASNIPAPKLDLIKQAMAATKVDQKIRGLVDQRIEMRALRIRGDNPDMTDSLYREVRTVVSDVYVTNSVRPGGLFSRVYALIDRNFTENDLKFAVNFNSSDQGKRFRERVPRLVNESQDIGRKWSESLEPEIRSRLETKFRGLGLKF
jgi:hypothetical protein